MANENGREHDCGCDAARDEQRRPWWRLVLVAVAAYLVFGQLLIPLRLQGDSMAPSYRDGGFTFINRLSCLFAPPQRGDVVAIQLAGRSMMYLKRVVGLPGERIAFQQGKITVDGVVLAEPYVVEGSNWTAAAVVVGDGELYAVGDNRSGSRRGHAHGIVARRRVVGRTLW